MTILEVSRTKEETVTESVNVCDICDLDESLIDESIERYFFGVKREKRYYVEYESPPNTDATEFLEFQSELLQYDNLITESEKESLTEKYDTDSFAATFEEYSIISFEYYFDLCENCKHNFFERHNFTMEKA